MRRPYRKEYLGPFVAVSPIYMTWVKEPLVWEWNRPDEFLELDEWSLYSQKLEAEDAVWP